MRVIFGDMEFGEFSVGGDTPTPICIIRTVQAVMDVPTEDAADALLGQYDSYVVPDLTDREILYAPGAWSAITKEGEKHEAK